jgi:hypothetical protein
MKKLITGDWKELNFFSDIFFPLVLAILGVYIGLKWQGCNEKTSERDRVDNYMHSMVADLKKDSTRIDSISTIITKTMVGLDTALEQMQKPMKSPKNIKLNYIFIMKYDWFPAKVNFSEGTIIQLKYTGGLRLIENHEIADSIALYEVGKNLCHEESDMVSEAYKETFSTQKYVYNYKERLDFQSKLNLRNSYEIQDIHNDTLVKLMNNKVKMATSDKSKIIACYNDFANYQASLELYLNRLQKQKRITKNLIKLIEDSNQ